MITSGPMMNYANGEVREVNISGDSANMQRLRKQSQEANKWRRIHNEEIRTSGRNTVSETRDGAIGGAIGGAIYGAVTQVW